VGELDQETQVRNSDVYDDTIAAGSGLESPAAANQNIRFDLNALRSRILDIIDPQSQAGTADWFVDLASALDNFGLRQIHDKKFVFILPFDANNAFTLGALLGGVLVSSAMVAGAAGIIAVGPASIQNAAYVAADEANFTVAGTLGIGLSQAASAAGAVLNEVSIFVDGTNDPPLDGGSRVFGLLQVINGTSDGTAIAAAASENLQISFVKVDPGTDAIVAVSLPAATYQFRLPFQQCFYDLDPGALLGGVLPDVIDPGSTIPRRPFRHIDVTSGPASTGDPLNIQTGAFTTAGAQTVFASFGTPILPATAAQFRDDERVVIIRNGNTQSKGAGKDVQYVSTTQISFAKTVKPNDEIVIISPSSF